MKTPKYWSKRGFFSELLLPFSVVYYLAVCIKKLLAGKPKKLSVPVVCVGNITAGGTGKTPTCLAVAQHLMQQGKKVAFVSRGYGGSSKNITKVDTEQHTAKEVGDEPLLLAQTAPCYVAKNRYLAGKKAVADGADLIIMDDGLQHRSLYQDHQIVVFDGPYGIGNGRIIPSGPLRDKFSTTKHANAFLIVGEDEHEIAKKLDAKKVIMGQMVPDVSQPLPDKAKKYFMFAGIGRPEKFFQTALDAGYEMAAGAALPDHHAYPPTTIEKLHEWAENHKTQDFLTTSKDVTKLPAAFAKQVAVLPVVLACDIKALLEGLEI